MAQAKRDENYVPSLLAVTDDVNQTVVPVLVDPDTGRILISATVSGAGGTPGGLDTELQWNDDGAFGGITGATTDGTAVTFATGALLAEDITASDTGGVAIKNDAGTDVAVFGNSTSTTTSLLGTTNIGSGSADYIQIAGGTGSTSFTATGSSTNINISLVPKGTGKVNLGSTNISFSNDNGGDSGLTVTNTSTDANGSYAGFIGNAQNGTVVGGLYVVPESGSVISGGGASFGTISNHPMNLRTNDIERWKITTSGVLESTGAQTIQTTTGNLTIGTGAGNGNIILSPHGTGQIQNTKVATFGNGTSAGEIRILEGSGDGTNYSAIRGSARSSDITYVLPTTDPTDGQVMAWSAPVSNVSTGSFADVGGGGGAWELVSYTTGSGVSSFDVSSLDLSTDLHYRVIVQYTNTGAGARLQMRMNGQTGSVYTSAHTYVEYNGSYATDGIDGQTASVLGLSAFGSYTSHQSNIDISLLKVSSTVRPSVQWDTVSSGTYIRKTNGGGFINNQTNVTALNFLTETDAVNGIWHVWVLKPKTS